MHDESYRRDRGSFGPTAANDGGYETSLATPSKVALAAAHVLATISMLLYNKSPGLNFRSGVVTKEVLCRANPDLWELRVSNHPERPGQFPIMTWLIIPFPFADFGDRVVAG